MQRLKTIESILIWRLKKQIRKSWAFWANFWGRKKSFRIQKARKSLQCKKNWGHQDRHFESGQQSQFKMTNWTYKSNKLKQTLLHFQKVAFWANFCFENNENFLNTEKLETSSKGSQCSLWRIKINSSPRCLIGLTRTINWSRLHCIIQPFLASLTADQVPGRHLQHCHS
jgi:hypothetical protein